MYTNLEKHGGKFKNVLDEEFSKANNVTIASGYISLDTLNYYEKDFIKIASEGGVSRLMLGMAFYEGLSQKKLDAVLKVNEKLTQYNNLSGIYVANGRRYHGKVYHFSGINKDSIYVGSSNFSITGTRLNIECTIPVNDSIQKDNIISFLEDLYSEDYAIPVNKAEIIVPYKHRTIKSKVKKNWENLKRFDSSKISLVNLPKFEFSLKRIVDKPKSNLNIYFGKGRWSRSSGKILPRAWYEIELIASNDINSHPLYPKGDFTAYTDDGYIIPMRTQGDYYKNIRSRNSLQIFGIWLKGKLEASGVLNKYQPVTANTLEEYGTESITFYKIEEGRFFLQF